MIQLTEQNLSAAAERARRRRPHVRRVREDFYDVRCDLGHTHRVRFSRTPVDTFAECYFPDTGEACPASLGKKLCYHVFAAFALRGAIDQVTAHAARQRRDLDGETEIAVLYDAPLPAFPRFECRRSFRAPEPEGDPEALLAGAPRPKTERAGRFHI